MGRSERVSTGNSNKQVEGTVSESKTAVEPIAGKGSVLEGERTLTREPARATTGSLDSVDRPEAWIDRGYR